MNENLYCSFCAKSVKEVRTLIASDNAKICNECVTACVNEVFIWNADKTESFEKENAALKARIAEIEARKDELEVLLHSCRCAMEQVGEFGTNWKYMIEEIERLLYPKAPEVKE
jgi:ATP-dependent Clp protease ATP-binding subunit ClpX